MGCGWASREPNPRDAPWPTGERLSGRAPFESVGRDLSREPASRFFPDAAPHLTARVRVLKSERALAGEHFVEHAAGAEQVAARVDLLALQLLRRHVLKRPLDLALLGQPVGQRCVGFLEYALPF